MRTRSIMTLIVLLAALAGVPSAKAQGPYSLEYKLEKGKAYLYSDTITVEATQEMMGQEQKSNSSIMSISRIVPNEILTDGSTVLFISPDSIRVHFKSAQMDTVLVPVDMLGKRNRLTLSKKGEVSHRAVVDSIKTTGLMQAFGQRETIRFHGLPPKAVSIGESWTVPRTDSVDAMGGKMVTVSTMNYTLKGKETKMGKECLKVVYTGKLTITGKGSMQGMQVYVEGSGTITGTALMDPVSCLSVYEESKTEMESTAALTGAQNMTIPSSQTVINHRVLLSK